MTSEEQIAAHVAHLRLLGGFGNTVAGATMLCAADTIDRLQRYKSELEQQVDSLKTWDGLMATLDKFYPVSLVPTLPDDEKRDPGARIVSLVRTVAALRESNERFQMACDIFEGNSADSSELQSTLIRETGIVGSTKQLVDRLLSEVAALRADAERLGRRNAELTVSEEEMAGRLRVAESHRKMVCGLNKQLQDDAARSADAARE